jgi:hypothetical protein
MIILSRDEMNTASRNFRIGRVSLRLQQGEVCGTPLTPAGTDVARRCALESPPCERRVSVGLLGPFHRISSGRWLLAGGQRRAIEFVDDCSVWRMPKGAMLVCVRPTRDQDVACRAATLAVLLRASKRSSASQQLSVMTIDCVPTRFATPRTTWRVGVQGQAGAGWGSRAESTAR